MFDIQVYLEDLKVTVEVSKKPLPADLYQPEFYYSLLKANILKLPDEWDSRVQTLIYEQSHPDLNTIAHALSNDLQATRLDEQRTQCYQLLLRFAIVLGANETEHA